MGTDTLERQGNGMDEKEKRPADIQTVFEKLGKEMPLEQRVTLLEKATALLLKVLLQNFGSNIPGTKTNIEAELETGLGEIIKDL